MTGASSNQQQANASDAIAILEIDELVQGRLLGTGGFCNVHEIRSISLNKEAEASVYIPAERLHRRQLKATTKSKNGQRRYVVKSIKPERMEPKKSFMTAAYDLEMEARILSKIRHPNIIRLRGIALGGLGAFAATQRHDGYFLILDRLDETLKDRIISWKRREKALSSRPNMFANVMSNHQDRIERQKQQLFLERLTVAMDIASALEYLHSNAIIYRDLKSVNCGFDSDGNVCIFDFGLARPLPGDTMEDTYKMSGKAGTTRYMAPEVFLCQPYSLKADVFSFAHLLHEILSGKVPYENYTKGDYKQRVVKRGVRPKIDKSWPVEIQELLTKGWAGDMDERPTMAQVRETLANVVSDLEAMAQFRPKAQTSRRSVSPQQEVCESLTFAYV